jgi:hypothetical protein
VVDGADRSRLPRSGWLRLRPDGTAAVEDPEGPVSLEELLDCEKKIRSVNATPPECVELRRRYARAHGGSIRDVYLCEHLDGAGVVLTGDDQIRMRYPADDVAALQPEFEETLWRAAALSREGAELLVGRRREILVQMLQSVIVYLLSVLDSQHAPLSSSRTSQEVQAEDRIQKALDTANQELGRVSAYLEESAQRVAQRYYLTGMPVGVVLVLILAFASRRLSLPGVEEDPLVVTIVAGGLGAIISVMTRIASGKLTLDSHADHWLTLLSGSFRPVIGAILGLAIYVLVRADLVPLEPSDRERSALYFHASLGFLAGFSERWAQDMLAKTSARTGIQGETETTAPPRRRGEGPNASS